MDYNQLRLSSICKVAKEAWYILQVAHEGTSIMKSSKHQMLTLESTIRDDEQLKDFYAKLDEHYQLGVHFGEDVFREKNNEEKSEITT